MPKGRGQLPSLYYPADIAAAIGMSEWWVKEQARRGRIPFTKPGRAYRFTADQFAEIVRMYEVRPNPGAAPQVKGTVIAVAKMPDRVPQQARPAVRLRARPPRRAALHQQDAA
ncbi:DNA-binding protein [Kitasatospora sp. NBC_00458]|uniref:DNA-binding protein n=1 Tax=Kitasatospora sp. NBC_00458 TaxID=2903568 RepID=UPI002E17DC3F